MSAGYGGERGGLACNKRACPHAVSYTHLRAETSEDIEKLQKLTARIEADTSTLTEIVKDGSTYMGCGTEDVYKRQVYGYQHHRHD